MVGFTKVKFGAGVEVLDITAILETRRIVIENIHQTSTNENVKAALEVRFGEVREISLLESEGRITALVTMSSSRAAEDAIGFIKHCVPEGLIEAPSKRLVSYGVPETRLQNGPNPGTTIEVTCHYPSRLAWAHFSHSNLARAVARELNGSKLLGRQLQARYEPPSPQYYRLRSTLHSVAISNLPVNVIDRVLQRRIHGFNQDIQIEPPRYTLWDFETHMPHELRKHGDLISFEVSPVRDGSTKIYAFARFSTVQESLQAVTELQGRKLDCLNGS